jgi:hypothetical protein
MHKREMWAYWQAEENKHQKAYEDYMSRPLYQFRFGKQIDYHVRKANEAQREKLKY